MDAMCDHFYDFFESLLDRVILCILPFICVAGVVGNIISIIIWSKDDFKQTLFIIVLAVLDMTYLLLLLVNVIFATLIAFDLAPTELVILYEVLFRPPIIENCLKRLSGGVICLIGIELQYAVYKPLRVQSVFTIKVQRYLVIVVIVLMMALHSPVIYVAESTSCARKPLNKTIIRSDSTNNNNISALRNLSKHGHSNDTSVTNLDLLEINDSLASSKLAQRNQTKFDVNSTPSVSQVNLLGTTPIVQTKDETQNAQSLMDTNVHLGRYILVLQVLTGIIPSLLIVGLNVSTAVGICCRRKTLMLLSNTSNLSYTRELRTAITLVLVISSYVFTFVPAIGMFMFVIIQEEATYTFQDLYVINTLSFSINSSMNVVLYYFRSQQFKDHVHKLFKCTDNIE